MVASNSIYIIIMSETTSNKKQRLDNGVDEDVVASFTSLSTDILANIFGHLPLKEIMRVRRVCKKTIDAVKETLVPLESNKYRCFRIDSIKMYNALVVMAEVLPGLQQIRVDGPSYSSKRREEILGTPMEMIQLNRLLLVMT